MTSKKNKFLSTTLSVTLVIFLSKGIGFVREMIMAYYFGRGMATDAYNSAYSLFYLPVLLFSSCVTSTLVPLYIQSENSLGRDAANRFGSNTLNLFMAFALGVSALMTAFARPLVRIVYPGFSGEAFDLTVSLSRVMFPALLFFVAGIVLSTILNAQEHYLAAQLTGFPLSFSLITAAILFNGTGGIRAQAWGVFIAGVLQVAILCPALRKDFRYSFTFDIRDAGFRKLIILAVPAVLSMAVNELNHMIDRMLASALNAGDISSMAYAFKIVMFMMGVIVVPLTTIAFSNMSRTAANKNIKAFSEQVRDSVALLSSVIFPLVMIAAVCSKEIIRLAYFRGQFDETSVLLTGEVFLFYVVGVPFYGLRDIMNRVYHSLQDTKTPMIVACVSMAVNIALNLVLRRAMGVNGLAFATTVAALIGVILLSSGIERRIRGTFNRAFASDMLRILVSSAFALAVSFAVSRLIPPWTGTFKVFLWLAVVAGCGLTAYVAACFALGVKQLRRLISLIKR